MDVLAEHGTTALLLVVCLGALKLLQSLVTPLVDMVKAKVAKPAPQSRSEPDSGVSPSLGRDPSVAQLYEQHVALMDLIKQEASDRDRIADAQILALRSIEKRAEKAERSAANAAAAAERTERHVDDGVKQMSDLVLQALKA